MALLNVCAFLTNQEKKNTCFYAKTAKKTITFHSFLSVLTRFFFVFFVIKNLKNKFMGRKYLSNYIFKTITSTLTKLLGEDHENEVKI